MRPTCGGSWARTHTHHLDGDDCIQTNGKKEVLNCAVRMFPPPPEREREGGRPPIIIVLASRFSRFRFSIE